jgi:ABC-type transport system involved in cytochrome c biogenesis permease component
MPKLPVVIPTTIFSPVITTAAQTDVPAAERFSARINSGDGSAGVDMLALSLLGGKSDKRKQLFGWVPFLN